LMQNAVLTSAPVTEVFSTADIRDRLKNKRDPIFRTKLAESIKAATNHLTEMGLLLALPPQEKHAEETPGEASPKRGRNAVTSPPTVKKGTGCDDRARLVAKRRAGTAMGPKMERLKKRCLQEVQASEEMTAERKRLRVPVGAFP
jgi:hypothetical protein